MRRYLGIVTVAILFVGAARPATADSVPTIPPTAIPTVQCIHRVLKSSDAVKSVELYSDNEARFAVEYSFQNKAGSIVVFDIEFSAFGETFFVGDKIPREVSMETANEAQELEERLNLTSECHLNYAFDNLLPWPKARADWQRIDWPTE